MLLRFTTKVCAWTSGITFSLSLTLSSENNRSSIFWIFTPGLCPLVSPELGHLYPAYKIEMLLIYKIQTFLTGLNILRFPNEENGTIKRIFIFVRQISSISQKLLADINSKCVLLAHFSPKSHFYTPWKSQKTISFWRF